MRTRDGEAMVLGIRPEDLELARETGEAPSAGSAARVDLVELLGGEALVHLSAGATELTARMSTPVPSTGDLLLLHFPPERLHLFTAGDGALG